MPLVVHFKRPSGWRTPVNIHFWGTTPVVPATTWPGITMTAEANDWFVYQFATAEAASIVFNDGAGQQTGNLRRDRLGWFYTNNSWYDANPERPAIPVIRANPRARTYTTPQSVTLESSNDYDVIYYTMDGSDPTPPSPDGTFSNASTVRYTGPVTVAQSLTIGAIGVNSEGEVGQLRTFAYTIDPNADLEQPTIAASQPHGTYQTPIDVVFTVRDNRPAPVVAYYTLDGSAPSSASPVYVQGNASAGLTGPAIAVSAATTIRFLVIDGANNETRQSFYYNIGPAIPPVDFR